MTSAAGPSAARRLARAKGGVRTYVFFIWNVHRPAARRSFDNQPAASVRHTRSKFRREHSSKPRPRPSTPPRRRPKAGGAAARLNHNPTGRRRDRPTSRQAAFHPSSGGRSREACRSIYFYKQKTITQTENYHRVNPGHHVPARFVSVIYNTPSSTTHAVSSARTAPINAPPRDQAPASTDHASPATATFTSRAST